MARNKWVKSDGPLTWLWAHKITSLMLATFILMMIGPLIGEGVFMAAIFILGGAFWLIATIRRAAYMRDNHLG
ncbi:hypothetical protein GCM10027261_04840 [Geodermatophilus arenarius]|uniref:SdpI/YhfL protein family protein n=1 Tax=Geodermatophilus arenarius TaxID=1137990 RepID=A0ABV9LE72_9ACTN